MEKEETGEESPQKRNSKMDKELYWVLGAMIAVIAIFLIGFTFNSKSNSFEYKELNFKKEMLGNIPLYKHTYLTGKVIRTAAQVVRTQDAAAVVVLLRNDPRELEYIPVEGAIEYPQLEEFIYITVDSSPDLLCEYSTIAMAQISSFMNQNGFVARPGISDEATATEQNMEYVTCEDYPDRMVISFKAGDKTSIVREGNCYTINVANCEILPAAEKFILQSILDAREKSSPVISELRNNSS